MFKTQMERQKNRQTALSKFIFNTNIVRLLFNDLLKITVIRKKTKYTNNENNEKFLKI